MQYVMDSLGADEEVVHVGKFHWFYNVEAGMKVFWGFFWCLAIMFGGAYVYEFVFAKLEAETLLEKVAILPNGFRIVAFLSVILGLMKCAQLLVVKATTEIAITNNRLIYKRGLVARNVGEISIDRIEGVNVVQGVLGRIFNFGRIIVRGMGIGEVHLPPIQDPIEFRKAIERARLI